MPVDVPIVKSKVVVELAADRLMVSPTTWDTVTLLITVSFVQPVMRLTRIVEVKELSKSDCVDACVSCDFVWLFISLKHSLGTPA